MSASSTTLHALPISSPAELLLSIAWGLSGLALFLDLTFTHRLPTWAIAGRFNCRAVSVSA